MGKMIDEPLPFKILKQVPTKAWGLCDKCMELKPELKWNDYCILPIAAGMTVADNIGQAMADGFKISALYAWRKYKEIYSSSLPLMKIGATHFRTSFRSSVLCFPIQK